MVQLSPRKGPTPDVVSGARGYHIVTLSVLHRDQPDSVENSSMLQSGPTHSLVAKFLQHSVVTCSTQISCYKGRTLQTRPQTGVCEPLSLMSWRPKHIRTIAVMWAQQTYMYSVPSDSLLYKNLPCQIEGSFALHVENKNSTVLIFTNGCWKTRK